MAFNDTLFQLGMDLTRSSTAQKEDHSCAEFNAQVADPETSPIVEQSVSTAGTTIFIDLHGAKRLDDVKSAERATRRAVETLGLKLEKSPPRSRRRWRRVRRRGSGLRAFLFASLHAYRLRSRRRARMCRAEARGGADGSRQRLRGARGRHSAQTHGLRPYRAGLARGAQSTAKGSASEGTGESGLRGGFHLFTAKNRCRDRVSGRGFFLPDFLEFPLAHAGHVFRRFDRLQRLVRQKRRAGRLRELHEQQHR